MDDMDIDHIEVVPETPPDRLTGRNADRRSLLSASGLPGNSNNREGAPKILFEAKNNGFGKFSVPPVPKSFTPSSASDQNKSNFGLGNPRTVNEGTLDHDCYAIEPTKNNKKTCAQSSALEGGPTVNTEERGFRSHKKILSCAVPGNTRTEQTRKRLVISSSSSTRSNAGFPTMSEFVNKGKEAENSSSGMDKNNMATSANYTHRKIGNGKIAPTSSRLNDMPRVSGQKRLVRNGCISPLNIARTRESVGKEKVEPDNRIAGREWISNDFATLNSKGKEVMNSPMTVKEQEARSSNLSRRNSVSISEIVKEDVNTDRVSIRKAEENSGWISTRNRSTPTSLPSLHENGHKSGKNEVYLISESPTNVLKTGEGRGPGISDQHPINLDVTPTQNAPDPPENQKATHRRPELGQVTRHHAAANGLTKRPKQQFTSSRNGESSRAASDSPDVVIGSSGNARWSRTRLNSEVPVIEVDESSPTRGGDSSNQGSNSTDAYALARQMEADEILARELQEQLYNEGPSVDTSEMHARLQQDYDLQQSFSRRTGRNSSNARRSSVASSSAASSSGQPITSSSPTLPRRVSQSRAPNVNRMSRWRNRFPGRPRALASTRERGSVFPTDMDVELRMHILEALEAINDTGVNNSLLQTQRDFNENDYEMLLALDENNNHGGASASRINGLPQSTVQSENFDEACAVCLDTPTIGDVIRHLPCLHKFHKDCIDPWLRRKTSCPVCKSSIT